MLAASLLLACLPCHQQITEHWAASAIGNSFGLVDAASESAGRLHRASNTEFRIAPRDGLLELIWRGQRKRLDFRIGRVGRSFGFEEDGYLYQPVGFYAARQAWDMAPNYENDATPTSAAQSLQNACSATRMVRRPSAER